MKNNFVVIVSGDRAHDEVSRDIDEESFVLFLLLDLAFWVRTYADADAFHSGSTSHCHRRQQRYCMGATILRAAVKLNRHLRSLTQAFHHNLSFVYSQDLGVAQAVGGSAIPS